MLDRSMPPGMAGNPDWLHAACPCGHRFQAGQAVAAALCGCGRFAIGRCKDCDRWLCGDHGTQSSPFLCASCLRERRSQEQLKEKEEKDAAEAAVAAEHAAFVRSQAAARAALSTATTPARIARVLGENRGLLTINDCKAAWIRVPACDLLQPTHEFVKVASLPHLLILDWQTDTGWLWHTRGPRADGWRTTVGDSEFFVDREGAIWRSGHMLIPEWPNHVVLPRGARFRATWCPQSLGPLLLKNAKPRNPTTGVAVMQADDLDSATYGDVVASILSRQVK
jgi:hypothetical protein